MIDSMRKYPIGSKVRLSCDYPDDEPHEVIGYKQIGGANYLIFKDGQTALVGRVVG